jgi:hypothetical protein
MRNLRVGRFSGADELDGARDWRADGAVDEWVDLQGYVNP